MRAGGGRREGEGGKNESRRRKKGRRGREGRRKGERKGGKEGERRKEKWKRCIGKNILKHVYFTSYSNYRLFPRACS